jgi:8-oxo-dGTP pyrophosphatase MutT (NUDIX family)
MHYLQEHSFTTPIIKALVKMPDGTHFTVNNDLPKISINTEYMALPNQLIQNYLLDKFGLQTIYNNLSEISFRKSNSTVLCEMIFSFSELSVDNHDGLQTKFLTKHTDNTIQPYSIINYDKPFKNEYMQLSCGGIFKNKYNEILMMQKDLGNGITKWDLPGGIQDKMELPLQTATREFKEELNFSVPPENMMPQVIDFTNGVTELGLLGTRIIYNIDGKFSLNDFDILQNPDTNERVINLQFISLNNILKDKTISRPQKIRIQNATETEYNSKRIYSTYTNWMPKPQQFIGNYR